MKILFPIGSVYPSQQGGPSNAMFWIARELIVNNIEVDIVSTDAMIENKSTPNRWIRTDYGHVIFCKEFSYKLPIHSIFISLLKIKSSNVIHLNSIFYLYSLIIGASSIVLNKRIIWSVRGELDKEALMYSKKLKALYLFIFKYIFSKKIIFHVTSEAEKMSTQKIFGQEICIKTIPNYMILPEKINTPKKEYFSYIGRIHPIKAIENLIQGFSRNQKFVNSNYVLKIAGDYKNKYGMGLIKIVEKLGLNNKIIFCGHIEGYEKQLFLAESYFNFMPSHTENFGLVVIEAMAQGTPNVASINTPWKILNETKSGYWVDNTPAKISEIVDIILSLSKYDYDSLTNAALNLVTSEYNIKNNIHKWIDVYTNTAK